MDHIKLLGSGKGTETPKQCDQMLLLKVAQFFQKLPKNSDISFFLKSHVLGKCLKRLQILL